MIAKLGAKKPDPKRHDGEPHSKRQRSDDSDITTCGYFHFYRYRPRQGTVTMDELEEAVWKRFKLLSDIYALDTKGVSRAEIIEKINARDGLLDTYLSEDEKGKERSKEREEDWETAAHYLLRLAVCVDERWRTWLLKYETILFASRIQTLQGKPLEDMIQANLPSVKQLADSEKEEFQKHLETCLKLQYSRKEENRISGKWYKVPFLDVLQLVSNRKVFLNHGHAYIHEGNIHQLLEQAFRDALKPEIAKAAQARAFMQDDEKDRVLAFLNTVLEELMEEQATDIVTGKVDKSQIESLYHTHFPMCMRMIHRHLVSEHHLKHDGRWQYVTFLKQVGLSLEDALDFFSSNMTKNSSSETFARSEYGYTVRHAYGREGRKTSYTAHNCYKLIMGSTPVGEQVHGCPYKIWTQDKLKQELTVYLGPQSALMLTSPNKNRSSTGGDEIPGILDFAKAGHYTKACHLTFMASHRGAPDEGLFKSPAHYVFSGRKWDDARAASAAQSPAATATPSAMGTPSALGTPERASFRSPGQGTPSPSPSRTLMLSPQRPLVNTP